MGAVFLDGEGKAVAEVSKYLGETTNNVAEYLGLVYALHEAQTRGIRQLSVKTDSELLANQFNGSYKVRDGTLRLFYDLAIHMSKQFERLSIEHVSRNRNTVADRLAANAIALHRAALAGRRS